MTTGLIESFKKQIKSMPYLSIQVLLLENINDEAKALEFAFAKDKAMPFENMGESLAGLPRGPTRQLEANPLAIAFTFGSQALQNTLLQALTPMNPEDAVELLSKPWSSLLVLHDGFHDLYLATSKESRKTLSKWAASLEKPLLLKLFTRSNGFFIRPTAPALFVLAKAENEAVVPLVKAFKRFNNEELLSLFQTQSFPARYGGLVKLFASGIKEETNALLLLDLVSQLSDAELRLVFYGSPVYGPLQQETDCLMRYLGGFSSKLTYKALYLLKRLPESDIEKILLTGKNDWLNTSTALDTAFTANDAQEFGNEVAIAYINLLNRDSLRDVLYTAPRTGVDPFLHRLVSQKYRKATTHYLLQENLKINCVNAQEKTAHELALDMNQTEMMSLFQAHTVLHTLHDSSKPNLRRVRTLIKAHPNIGTTTWNNQQTLAHLAILKNNAPTLRLLLKYATLSANAVDEDGLSVLDYAFQHNELEIIEVILQCPKTILTKANKDGEYPLSLLLKTGDFTLLCLAMKKLQIRATEAMPSFAEGFKHLPASNQNTEALNRVLKNKETTKALALSDYCETNQDSLSLFLICAGQNLTATPSILNAAASVFVLNQLQEIENKKSAPLETKKIRTQLMLFFFSMEPSTLSYFLKSLTLTDAQGLQLDLIVCNGLLQPLFFSTLSLEDNRFLEQCFIKKTRSVTSVACSHFQHSDLTSLPPMLLVYYANFLPEKIFYSLAMNRSNAALIVLALEKSFHSGTQKSPHQALLAKLEAHLNALDKSLSPEECNELRLLLNLARSDAIKQIIRAFILSHPGVRENCEQLFSAFHPSPEILEKSLLRALLLGFAKDQGIAKTPQNQLVFEKILLIATPEEFVDVVRAQLSYKEGWSEDSLSELIINGVIDHPQSTSLIEPLFQWAMSENFKGSLIPYLPDLLKISTTAVIIDKLLGQAFAQNKATQAPISDLQFLCSEDCIPPSDLMDKMTAWQEEQLHSLIRLSAEAGLLEINAVLAAFLNAKKSNLPLSPDLVARISRVNVLKQLIKAHQLQYKELLSLLALKEGLYRKGRDVIARLDSLSQLIQQEESSLTPDAILLWIESYRSVLKKNEQAAIQAFIHALALLMRHALPRVQLCVLQEIPEDLLEILLTQCLLGMHSDDARRAEDCTELLTSLANTNALDNKNNAHIITRYLGHYDTAFLKESTLIDIAKTILKDDSKDLDAATLNGIWIVRLLTSALFLAHADKNTVSLLFTRLRLYISALKEHEYVVRRSFLDKENSFSEFGEAMASWRKELLSNPKRKGVLLEKLARGLKFRADHSIGEIQLQAFEAIKTAPPEIAQKAKATFYGYYNQQLSHQCTHFLFQKMANVLYWTTQDLGDIPLAKSTLYQWLHHYVPNFEQREFAQKNQSALYNQDGIEIGFMNDRNYALTPQQGLLIDREDAKPGMELFDANRNVIGILKASGEVDRKNSLQKTLSALTLASVPKDELVQSNTLRLLTHDVLFENTAEFLYQSLEQEDSEKRAWIESLLNQELIKERQVVPPSSLKSLLMHHQRDMVTVLIQIELTANARALFYKILNHKKTRKSLFANKTKDLTSLLERLGPEETLAHFLLHHHKKTWFAEGLAFFASHLKNRPHALIEAILRLDPMKESFASILDAFLSTEEVARIILKDFLRDEGGFFIQDSLTEAGRQLTYLFDKEQIINCIHRLAIDKNKKSLWWNPARYRLLLLFFAAHQEILFEQVELRYGGGAWNSQELVLIAQFVKAHFALKNNPDKNLDIGKKLLSELVFRSTNFGHVHPLFYNQAGFNPQIAGFKLVKSKPSLTESLKNTFVASFLVIQKWLDSKKPQVQEAIQFLKENKALVDWEEIASNTWFLAKGDQLPLFCAFLFNYIGPSAPLERLLDDFISSPALLADRNNLYSLSRLLTQIPEHPVSTLVFLSLARHPEELDDTILKDMVYFYHKTQLKSEPFNPLCASLDLIEYFGQQKEYKVAAQCCTILKPQLSSSSDQKSMEAIQTEAKVEEELNQCRASWYFFLLRFFKRLWYYSDEPSSFICFCDEPIRSPSLIVPTEIGEKDSGGKFHEDNREFSRRLKLCSFYPKQEEKEEQATVKTPPQPLQTKSVFATTTKRNPDEQKDLSRRLEV